MIVAVNKTEPIQLVVETDDGVMLVDCEVHPYPSYKSRFQVEGLAAIAVIPEDSDFWHLAGTDVDGIYFQTAYGKNRIKDVYFYADASEDGAFIQHSNANGWESWMKALPQSLGYVGYDWLCTKSQVCTEMGT